MSASEVDLAAIRARLHDRIGGLCCRCMTLVAPLSGGVVEQAYRLRDEIMAAVAASDTAEVDRLREALRRVVDVFDDRTGTAAEFVDQIADARALLGADDG